MPVSRSQAPRFHEGDHLLIILFGRPKPFRELPRCQIVMKIGTGWIVDLQKQSAEVSLVSQRQSYRQIQPVCRRKLAQRLQMKMRYGRRGITSPKLSAGILSAGDKWEQDQRAP